MKRDSEVKEAYLGVDNSINGCVWKSHNSNMRTVEAICQKYNLPEMIARVLEARDINLDDVESFIDPKIAKLLPNPFILKDMDKAAIRLADAIENKEKIAIIGDYDVDGATSSSLLKLFLDKFELNTIIHIPERDEGYGPSEIAFNKFKKDGYKLVVTTDCGTSAFDILDWATNKGFEVIVADHHEAEVKLPNAYAVVNPKRLDNDDNPCRIMAAVGVVFLLIVAINKVLRDREYYKYKQEPNLLEMLDLVALGTVCDVVPLTGINRAYVKQGLKIIAKRKNVGLVALSDVSGINQYPTAYHLGFVLGPRINAGGRVGVSSTGARLLSCTDLNKATELAKSLQDFNNERKEIENFVLLEAIEQAETVEDVDAPLVFVYSDKWHQGVIGIVAGKLKERYNLPAFVMDIEEDEVKGSARSVDGIDIGAAIIAAKEKGILTKGGGHNMAAGFSLKQEKLDEFREFLKEYINGKVSEKGIVRRYEVSASVDLRAANIEQIEKLSILAPFGASNPEPRFAITHVRIANSAVVGSGHIRCDLTSSNGGRLKAIAFNVADSDLGQALLSNNEEVMHLAGILRVDEWQGRKKVQFIIEDGVFVSKCMRKEK